MTNTNFNKTSSVETQSNQFQQTRVMIIKENSKTFSILGLVFGLLSVFIMTILFVPLSILFSAMGLLKRDTINLILGASGLVLSLIGLMTSPILMALIGLGFMR